MKSDDSKTAEDIRAVNDDKVCHNHKKNKPPFHCNDKEKTGSDKTKPSHKKDYQCFHCGGKQRHKLENCPAFGKVCKKCSKANHFASVCRSVSCTSQVKQMASISDSLETETSETESDKYFYRLHVS